MQERRWACLLANGTLRMSEQASNSLVDEVHSLRLELVGAVQVSEDEDVCGVLHAQTCAQSILAHHLQSLQSILTEGAADRGETAGKLNYSKQHSHKQLSSQGVMIRKYRITAQQQQRRLD